MPIPARMASAGDRNRTGVPLMRISPHIIALRCVAAYTGEK
jgi:hypothetical protein